MQTLLLLLALGEPVLLAPDAVFDGTSESAHVGWAVLVSGGKVAAVGARGSIKSPAGTKEIDLRGTTLLPGLMDLHSHVFLHPYNEALWDDQVLKEPVAYRVIAAVEHCE